MEAAAGSRFCNLTSSCALFGPTHALTVETAPHFSRLTRIGLDDHHERGTTAHTLPKLASYHPLQTVSCDDGSASAFVSATGPNKIRLLRLLPGHETQGRFPSHSSPTANEGLTLTTVV